MVNYYDILKVSPKASKAEIKSAYRRLARKLHPDSHTGSEETALKFAEIAEAYEILGNSKERAKYDQRILQRQFNNNGDEFSDSLFNSSNRHAQRWRQMVYEKRYNDIIDRMMEEERLEATAFQRAIFPLVSFLVSTVIVTAIHPQFFAQSGVVGEIAIVSLFVAGIIHLIGRLREGFERYTERDDNIHDSILDENYSSAPRKSQYAVAAALLGGIGASVGLGFLIGTQVHFAADLSPSMFSRNLLPEFLFYPPIITLFVDLIHSVAYRFER